MANCICQCGTLGLLFGYTLTTIIRFQDGRVLYLPTFQFRERLETGKTRVLFATPSTGDRRALFLLLRAMVLTP